MTPEEAIKTVWPHGNVNMNPERIEGCIPKVESKLEKHGFTSSCHGSYIHMAMEIIADREGLEVVHTGSSDIVTLIAHK